METTTSTRIQADIERLETGLRQLKIQYDMFFSGALPREPCELRSELERLIKRYAHAPIRKYAHRFHFNSLVSRYNSLSELWSKTVRTMEEGNRPAIAVTGRATAERIVATCRVSNPAKDHEALRILHERFLRARDRVGERKGRVPFRNFVHGIVRQAEMLRQKSGCDRIELRLVIRDQKVRLLARPGD